MSDDYYGTCPECGKELYAEEEGDGVYVWNEYYCPDHGLISSDEPDWDSMKGGHDYEN